ncbi:Ribonuclease Z, chloroplastic [Madurella mycetomatis]|uniref:Ribonuclease Z, chloroplastic n=1 Tax=Madurella mycetomatis TaxID=100816 RepID=A0A175W5E3_9PEZI|nr:Ribonuclease Z, chloroplastic [Madurella mycetomatis]
MPSATFATPLPQSPRSDILEWRFPKPYHNLILTGRSRAASRHTGQFVIPQLNLLLDAGLCVNNLRPKHIFLTHGHSDHALLAPAFVTTTDPPDIFCPAEMKEAFDNFVNAKTILNKTGGLWPPSASASAPPSQEDEDGSGNGDGDGDEGNGNNKEDEEKEEGIPAMLRTHVTHPLREGDAVALRRLPASQGWTATAFQCDHTVPCLGYLFSAVTYKLRPEYRSLSGPELRALREEQGVQITGPVETPVFAFLGDTTAATLAAAPHWLAREDAPVRVVITECSFLKEEHRAQADKTKHTIWTDLEKVVRRWPRTVFVLMHFSLRYSDEEVRRFFEEMGDEAPGNVVIWVDGGGKMGAV